VRGTSGTLRLVYVRYDIAPIRSERARTQDRKKEGGRGERERREKRKRTFFYLARQSGNACSVCLLSANVRLWGAVRHGTGEKKCVL